MNGKLIPALLGMIAIMIGAFLTHSCTRDDRQDARLNSVKESYDAKLSILRDRISQEQASKAGLERDIQALRREQDTLRIQVLDRLVVNIRGLQEQIEATNRMLKIMYDKDRTQK